MDSWETQLSRYHIKDIDTAVFEKFLYKAKENGCITFKTRSPRDAMIKLELAEGDTLLNAGAALFVDSEINKLQMARFASDLRLTLIDIKRYTGPIFNLADKAVEYIIDAMDWRVEFDGGLERKEYPEVPVDAIREAITNAFVHRNIESMRAIEVTMDKSFIDIYSPGKFPEGVTPKQFITQTLKPIRRNPLITRTMNNSEGVGSFATGLKRIYDVCSKTGVKIEYIDEELGFKVRFHRHCGEGWQRTMFR